MTPSYHFLFVSYIFVTLKANQKKKFIKIFVKNERFLKYIYEIARFSTFHELLSIIFLYSLLFKLTSLFFSSIVFI